MGEFCRGKHAIEPICITPAVNRYDNIVMLEIQFHKSVSCDDFYAARAAGGPPRGIRGLSAKLFIFFFALNTLTL